MISLIISTDYSNTTFALYQEKALLALISEENKYVSKCMITHIESLCAQFNITPSDLNFIGINQGPGPFTTLRVTLATINGLAFALGIPLVGVDGLKALIQENPDTQWPITVALLNAFNDDAYYAIQQTHAPLNIGYKKIMPLLADIKELNKEGHVRLIGAGVITFAEQINQTLGSYVHIAHPLPLVPSIDVIAKEAHRLYEHGSTEAKLLPLYLKIMEYKKSITL